MFYSFETEEHLARSGILHYHVGESASWAPATTASSRPPPSTS